MGKNEEVRGEQERNVATLPEGDETAVIERLYDLYGGIAFGLACRIVHDRSAAEEVVQDAFLNAWRHLGGYDASRGHVRSWLLTIVRNRAIDRVRASGRTRDEAPLEFMEWEAAAPDTWEAVALNAERERIRNAFAQLTESQRRTISLAYFGGYSHKEISAKMGVPLGTVKSRMRCGLLNLRAYLPNSEPGQTPTASNHSRVETPTSIPGPAG